MPSDDSPMRPPKLPHDDPELEPLIHGATPEEREERWAELARRLGSALALALHMERVQTEHGAHLATHDREIRDLQEINEARGPGIQPPSIEDIRLTLTMLLDRLPALERK
jgi:hypothetical protein